MDKISTLAKMNVVRHTICHETKRSLFVLEGMNFLEKTYFYSKLC